MKKFLSEHPYILTCTGVFVFVTFIILLIGPYAVVRDIKTWQAQAYGSDWLVVQYSSHGDVINKWKLEDASITSEENSDGIYFVNERGNVVHIGGHYNYVEIRQGEWRRELKKLTSIYQRNSH